MGINSLGVDSPRLASARLRDNSAIAPSRSCRALIGVVEHALLSHSLPPPFTRHEVVGLSTWLGAWAMLMPNTLHFTSEYNFEYSHFFSEYSQSTVFQSPSIECSFHIKLSSM